MGQSAAVGRSAVGERKYQSVCARCRYDRDPFRLPICRLPICRLPMSRSLAITLGTRVGEGHVRSRRCLRVDHGAQPLERRGESQRAGIDASLHLQSAPPAHRVSHPSSAQDDLRCALRRLSLDARGRVSLRNPIPRRRHRAFADRRQLAALRGAGTKIRRIRHRARRLSAGGFVVLPRLSVSSVKRQHFRRAAKIFAVQTSPM